MNDTQPPLKILGLGGSLRPGSYSLEVLKIALAGAEKAGAAVELLDISRLDLPFFQPEQPVEAYPQAEALQAYLAKFQAADGFIWSAPTYHATPAAPFKNALDLLELLPRRPRIYLSGKVIGLLALAGGTNAGAECLTALYYNARALKGLVVPNSFQVSPTKNLFASGKMEDERLLGRLMELGTEVANLAHKLK